MSSLKNFSATFQKQHWKAAMFHTVKQTFPSSQRQRASKSRTKHVLGIELAGAASDAMPILQSEEQGIVDRKGLYTGSATAGA